MPAPTPHRIDPPSDALPSRVAPAAAAPITVGAARCQESVEQPLAGRSPAWATDGPGGGDGSLHPGGPQTSSSPLPATDRDSAEADEFAGHHDWLRLHAAELLDRLQYWASDLDAREARLNARLSVQDYRERRFRLLQQDVAAQLAEQQRSSERLREENLAQARRLAFQSE
jgi:hypothetical protein